MKIRKRIGKETFLRPLDSIGRIVLPMQIRKELIINGGTSLEYTIDGDKIVIKKYTGRCAFCLKNFIDTDRSSVKDHIEFNGKTICRSCLADIKIL
jgi:transcriptional pleiotropic regulator of transition state genes